MHNFTNDIVSKNVSSIRPSSAPVDCKREHGSGAQAESDLDRERAAF